MDLSASTLWWLVAGALVAVELATGTFYLLMLSLGCVAGALAAHAGLSDTPQMVTAAKRDASVRSSLRADDPRSDPQRGSLHSP